MPPRVQLADSRQGAQEPSGNSPSFFPETSKLSRLFVLTISLPTGPCNFAPPREAQAKESFGEMLRAQVTDHVSPIVERNVDLRTRPYPQKLFSLHSFTLEHTHSEKLPHHCFLRRVTASVNILNNQTLVEHQIEDFCENAHTHSSGCHGRTGTQWHRNSADRDPIVPVDTFDHDAACTFTAVLGTGHPSLSPPSTSLYCHFCQQ